LKFNSFEDCILIGFKKAEIPNTRLKLAILEPTILPTINDWWFSKAAIILTTNSGKLVPNATTVIPITILDILKILANFLLLLINKLAQ